MGTLPADRSAEGGVLRAPELRLVHGRADFDLPAAERAVADLLAALGQDLDDERPEGVGVVVEAEHLCMTLRGVQATGSRTVTSALHGLLRDDPGTRAEFLAPAGVRP